MNDAFRGIEITLRAFKSGGFSFEPGDRYDQSKAQLNDAMNNNMHIQRYVGPLTREAYDTCMRQRPAGSIGRGFTTRMLIEMGILDREPDSPLKTGDEFEPPEGSVQHEMGWIVPRKSGHFVNYDVRGADGVLLRPQGFKSVEKAKAFLDAMLEVRQSTDSKDQGSSGADEEFGDDLQLQREPGGSDQPHQADAG